MPSIHDPFMEMPINVVVVVVVVVASRGEKIIGGYYIFE